MCVGDRLYIQSINEDDTFHTLSKNFSVQGEASTRDGAHAKIQRPTSVYSKKLQFLLH